jgi:hypothetical protein
MHTGELEGVRLVLGLVWKCPCRLGSGDGGMIEFREMIDRRVVHAILELEGWEDLNGIMVVVPTKIVRPGGE